MDVFDLFKCTNLTSFNGLRRTIVFGAILNLHVLSRALHVRILRTLEVFQHHNSTNPINRSTLPRKKLLGIIVSFHVPARAMRVILIALHVQKLNIYAKAQLFFSVYHRFVNL